MKKLIRSLQGLSEPETIVDLDGVIIEWIEALAKARNPPKAVIDAFG